MAEPFLSEALGAERRGIVRAVIAGVFVGLSTVGLAGTSAWLIVRASQHPAILALSVPMGLVQLFALAKAVGRYLERVLTHRSALAVMERVRRRVAETLEPLTPAGLGRRPREVVDLALHDLERVQDLLTAVAGPLVTSAVAGLVTAAVAGVIAPLAGLFVALGVVVTSVVLPLVGARAGASSEADLDEVRRELADLVSLAVVAGDDLVMNGASEDVMRSLDVLEVRHDRARRRRDRVVGFVGATHVLVAGATTLAAALVSARALASGHLAVSLVATPTLLAIAAIELSQAVVPGLVGISSDMRARRRLEALGRLSPPVREVGDGVTLDSLHRVEVEDLTVAREGRRVVEAVTGRFGRDDVVSVEGPSGAGKTSLLWVLARLLDAESGRVRFDGVDLVEITGEETRRHVGLSPDEPYVFHASLAQNLRVVAPAASDDELRDALGAVGLDATVRSMPEGVDTVLAGGAGLSGGERRRLGAARAILMNREVALLDEPTEALDEEAADALLVAVLARRRGAVVFTSHRESDRSRASEHWPLPLSPEPT